jgi:hypothetical protein
MNEMRRNPEKTIGNLIDKQSTRDYAHSAARTAARAVPAVPGMSDR